MNVRTTKMMIALVLLGAGVAPLATTAHADCRQVEPAVAARARVLLESRPQVVTYCAPCGDVAPGVPAMAGTIAVRSPRPGLRELSLDGVVVDLASTFVQTSAAGYQNLANLAGCPTTDAPATLAVVPATRTGVLITADPRSAPAAWPALDPASPSSALVPASPAAVRHTSPLPTRLALLAAATTGFGAAGLALLALTRLRRRRTTLPRAVHLPLR